MNKRSRWAAFIGVVCGAELVVAAVIGGAGLAAFVSVEAAFVAVLLGGVAVWALLSRRPGNSTLNDTSPPHRDANEGERERLGS